MMIQRIYILTFCLAGGILSVFVLYDYSKLRSNHANDFIRKLPSHKVTGGGFVKIDGNNWYFTGGDSLYFYLGNWSQRNKLLKFNIANKDSNSSYITGFDSLKLYQGLYLRTTSTYINLFDGMSPVILSGNLKTTKLTKMHYAPYFTAALPLSDQSYILKVIQKGMENSLVKLTGRHLSQPYILEKQGDGIFSNDGVLTGTEDGSKVFYCFYYRNQFLCLDSNLNVLYKGKTIDTISRAQLKVSRINSEHASTISSPPLFVTKQAAANNKFLFVNSALRADNEVKDALDYESAIDVYSLKEGSYQFSFYLGNFAGEKLKDFRVYGHTLVALYDHYLYFYRLNF